MSEQRVCIHGCLRRVCETCDLADECERIEKQRDELADALRVSSVALDDWLNTYAAEFCDDGRVKEAYDRINESGGTIAYIADLQQEIRALLGKGAG